MAESEVGRVSAINLEAALEMGSSAWDRLALCHPFPSVFMSWGWHQAWLHSSPRDAREAAFVLTDFSSASTLPPSIIVPLTRRDVALHRLRVSALAWCASDVGTPDHLDLLADKEADYSEVAARLWERPWDILILTSLEEEFPHLRGLLGALEVRGCRTTMERLWPCAQIHLPSTWEAYLQGLSGKRRYRILKDERDLRARYDVTVREYDLSSLAEGWEHLVRLHAARWGGRGSFRSPRLFTLYERFARILAEQNQLGLMGLEVDGEVVAIDFWAEFGGTMFGLQSGRDLRWASSSVGRVLRGLGIRRAIASGLRVADFSRGVEPYKRDWCPEERWCHEARVFRGTRLGKLLYRWDGLAVSVRPLRARVRTIGQNLIRRRGPAGASRNGWPGHGS